MLNQDAQEVVFLRGKLHLLITDFDDASDQIDRKITDSENRTFSVDLQLVSQSGSHTSQKFIHAEWLADVVIGAKIKCLDFPSFVPPAGQYDNRYVLVLATDRSPKLEPPNIRDDQIEDDQVRLLGE